MGTIAILGDHTTTTALATAASWDDDPGAILLEADRSGGSVAAWLDEPVDPSLSSIVANRRVVGDEGDGGPRWDVLAPMVRSSAAGLDHITLPTRSQEAAQAVARAELSLIPALAVQRERTVLLDIGRFVPALGVPRSATGATAIVVCHRQRRSSARAAAAHLYRLDEMVEAVAATDVPVVVALIGNDPYPASEVGEFLGRPESPVGATARSVEVVQLADDPLGASVLAGRAGVSARRLGRLPLMRTAQRLARCLRAHAHVHVAAEVETGELVR